MTWSAKLAPWLSVADAGQGGGFPLEQVHPIPPTAGSLDRSAL